MKKNFEYRLINNIQPIRYFALASAIYNLFATGIYDKLLKNINIDYLSIAKSLDLDTEKLQGLVNYLVNENILTLRDEKVVELTSDGRELEQFRGWYEMFIGGYGQTFLEMVEKIKVNSGSCSRNAEKVGIGSCAISHYDALPLSKKLIEDIGINYELVLDIGCGNAAYLLEFCRYFPNLKAVGVEPDIGGYNAALEKISNSDCANRIKIVNSSLQNFFANDIEYKPDLIIISFVLHEVLDQSGEQEVINFLRMITSKYPTIHLLIIEVDERINDKELMENALAKSYYNPYYLLHYFTNQKLETKSFWENIFKFSELEILSTRTTSFDIDSTGLELGYLLRKKNI